MDAIVVLDRVPNVKIISAPNTKITSGGNWSYKPVTTVEDADIEVISGPSWITSNGTTVYASPSVPTPVGGPYQVTISASKDGFSDGTQTFALTEAVLTTPPTASIEVTPKYGAKGTQFNVDASGSENYSGITITSGDGRSVNGDSVKWTYQKSGKYAATVYVTGTGSDSTSFDFLAYDQTYTTVAWTTIEYRYTPNIPLDTPVSFTLKDKETGAASSMVSWNETDRCITGTPQVPNINHTYVATLSYGTTTMIWDIVVGTATTFNPTADFTPVGKGLNIELTLSTNIPIGGSAQTWTIKNKATGVIVNESKARNPPPLSVPSAGMYTVTLTLSSSSGTAPTVTKDVYVPGNATPPADDDSVPKIICFILIILGALIIIVGARFHRPGIVAVGVLLIIVGILFFLFVDTSAIDRVIQKIFKGEE
jgi:hypothetical protein